MRQLLLLCSKEVHTQFVVLVRNLRDGRRHQPEVELVGDCMAYHDHLDSTAAHLLGFLPSAANNETGTRVLCLIQLFRLIC